MLFVGYLIAIPAGTLLLVGSSTLWIAGVLISLVTGILLLIGLPALFLGLWRLGTRYNNGIFNIIAILYFVPVVNIIAMILLYTKTNQEISSRR